MISSERDSTAFGRLHPKIQHHIWTEQWEELRDIQEFAIQHLLRADAGDTIIAAATASGKTEAAFLPLLSNMVATEDSSGLLLYVSPLKALINDQFRRLSYLCEKLDIPVWPWHGDVSASVKQRFRQSPRGVLLITPESLEASLCLRGFQVREQFHGLRAIVVDELHAFIGSERGKQLQSLLHRLDVQVRRETLRVGLSATLGDMRSAGAFLRPGSDPTKVTIIESAESRASIKMLLRGFEEQPAVGPNPGGVTTLSKPVDGVAQSEEEREEVTASLMGNVAIAKEVFANTRNTNNLVFCNSRVDVDSMCYLLRQLSSEAKVTDQYWPHHGMLSADLRKQSEAALLQGEKPATAICTSTLELGIDIGAVRSIIQVGPPPSVASLRQRLGRSGRRKGESSILRGYVLERAIHEKSSLYDALRLQTCQFAAMVSLLLEGWYEAPVAQAMHASTLVQQILSLVAERSGVTANTAFDVLCNTQKHGAFAVSSKDFASLLRHLARLELIEQESDSGDLMLGAKGERMVAHHSFYPAFVTPEEYRLLHGTKHLGMATRQDLLAPGDSLLFAGKTWAVVSIDDEARVIRVVPDRRGKPLKSTGGEGFVHTRVRARMYELYQGNGPDTSFMHESAQAIFNQGRRAFAEMQLGERSVVESGGIVFVFTWLGDREQRALALLLRDREVPASVYGPAIAITATQENEETVTAHLKALATGKVPSIDDLLQKTKPPFIEKWDWALPQPLHYQSYASMYLGLDGALGWLRQQA